MQNILFLIIGVAIGFFIKGKTTKTLAVKSTAEMADMRVEAKEAFKERLDDNLLFKEQFVIMMII